MCRSSASINYDSVWREPFCDWAEKILWDLIIPDELHRAKSAERQGVARIEAPARRRPAIASG